ATPIEMYRAAASARDQILDDGFDRRKAGAGRKTDQRSFSAGAQVELAERKLDIELVTLLQGSQHGFGKLSAGNVPDMQLNGVALGRRIGLRDIGGIVV